MLGGQEWGAEMFVCGVAVSEGEGGWMGVELRGEGRGVHVRGKECVFVHACVGEEEGERGVGGGGGGG